MRFQVVLLIFSYFFSSFDISEEYWKMMITKGNCFVSFFLKYIVFTQLSIYQVIWTQFTKDKHCRAHIPTPHKIRTSLTQISELATSTLPIYCYALTFL